MIIQIIYNVKITYMSQSLLTNGLPSPTPRPFFVSPTALLLPGCQVVGRGSYGEVTLVKQVSDGKKVRLLLLCAVCCAAVKVVAVCCGALLDYHFENCFDATADPLPEHSNT